MAKASKKLSANKKLMEDLNNLPKKDSFFIGQESSGLEYKQSIKKTPWISTAIQYAFLIAVVVLVFRGCNYHQLPNLAVTGSMPGYLVVIVGLSLAFIWVDVWKWGVIKPFNCIACLTAWFSIGIAFLFNTPYWYLYLPIGHLVGYLFTSIRLRWL